MKRRPSETYTMIQVAMEKYKTLSTCIKNKNEISPEMQDYIKLCSITFDRLYNNAECLIENCNRAMKDYFKNDIEK